ncbi:hypothetical protein ABK040_008248 [Willaertia magna]
MFGRPLNTPPSTGKAKIIHVNPSVVQKTKPSVTTTVQEIFQRRQLKFPIPIVTIPITKAPIEHTNPNPLDYPNVLIDKKTSIVIEDLSSDTENDYIKKLLESCGPYASWKRIKDPETNRWKTFGFCEYNSCSSAIRAMKLLNGVEIEPGIKIKVNCDKKVKAFMEQYKQKKLELWAQAMREKQLNNPSLNNTNNEVLTKEQQEFLAQLEKQMGTDQVDSNNLVSTAGNSNGQSIDIKENERKELENYEKALDDLSLTIIKELVNERMSIEEENRSRQSISQQLAVNYTVMKIAEAGDTEEAESKKLIIYDEIRRFRDNEMRKEEEIKEIERRRKEQIYRERRLKQSKQLERERRRRHRWEKENEEDRIEKEKIIRRIERFERMRERRYLDEGYISSDEEISTGAIVPEEKKIQINLGPALTSISKEDDVNKRLLKPSEEMQFEYEEEESNLKKKKKLSALEEIEKEQKGLLDRNAILDSLPQDPNELYNYPIDWNVIDRYSLWNALETFVNEKVENAMGGPEESLNQFILGKIETHSTPSNIIEDLSDVFDEQTNALVLELWQKLLVEMIRKQREVELENEGNLHDFE